MPLLEPFGHAAVVTRTNGRRFQDGFLTGLQVQGQLYHDTDDVCRHWNVQMKASQAKVLSQFFEMLSVFQTTNDLAASLATLHSVEVSQPTASLEVLPSPVNKSPNEMAQSVDGSGESILPILPLSALSFVLEENAHSSCLNCLPDCTVSCRLDGSLCQVRGGGTVTINNPRPLLQLPNGVHWLLGYVARSILVQAQTIEQKEDSLTTPAVVAHLNLEEQKLCRFATAIFKTTVIFEAEAPFLAKNALWNEMEHMIAEE